MPVFLKTQQNAILDAIRRAGFDPSEFAMDNEGGRVWHKATGFDIRLVVRNGRLGREFFAQLTPGMREPTETIEIYQLGGFFPRVGHWLACLRRELDAPDLWAEMRQEVAGRVELLIANDVPRAMDEGESQAVRQACRRLSDSLRVAVQAETTAHESMEELSRIVAAIEESVSSAAEAGNRTACLHLMLGLFASVALWLLPPEPARAFVAQMWSELRDLGQALGLLPP